MKKIIISSFLLFAFIACNNEDNKEESPKAEDDVAAAVNFVNAALKGNFKDARNYAVKDSTNLQFLDIRERIYSTMDPGTRENYAKASMRVYEVNRLNDSTTIVVYANSFKNDKDTLKVTRANDNWLVDIKYLWLHGEDSMGMKRPVKTDTLGR
jgi:hypothetical protein